MLHFTKKRAVIGAAIATLAMGAVAFAFFTSTGAGTGNATVGQASAFTVDTAAPTGTLYPGAGTSTFGYTITNPSPGHQNVSSVVATVATSGLNVVTGPTNTPVSGCLASWFHATANPGALPADLAGGDTKPGTVDVTMDNVNTSQDACQNVTPNITVSVS
jgi:hypothetical protein